MTSRTDAWAGLAEDIGTALVRFAERLRAAPEPTSGPVAVSGATQEREARMGASQMKVLEALRDTADRGLTAREVAEATGLKDTNTPNILRVLKGRGLVESTDTTPVIWRAARPE